MATDNIRADSGLAHPRPRAKSHARTRTRHLPRAATCARARHPRARLARGHARVPAAGQQQWWPAGGKRRGGQLRRAKRKVADGDE
jgi:hypothetical protein